MNDRNAYPSLSAPTSMGDLVCALVLLLAACGSPPPDIVVVFDAGPPADGGGTDADLRRPPTLPAEGVSLAADRVVPMAFEVAGRSGIAVDLQLANGSGAAPASLAAALFSVETEDGLLHSGIAETELHPAGCPASSSVGPGASFACTVVFELRASPPVRLHYRDGAREASALLPLPDTRIYERAQAACERFREAATSGGGECQDCVIEATSEAVFSPESEALCQEEFTEALERLVGSCSFEGMSSYCTDLLGHHMRDAVEVCELSCDGLSGVVPTGPDAGAGDAGPPDAGPSSCEAPPEVPSGPECAAATRACISSCGESDSACQADCYDSDPRCVECVTDAFYGCAARSPCGASWDRWACCAAANCPGSACGGPGQACEHEVNDLMACGDEWCASAPFVCFD